MRLTGFILTAFLAAACTGESGPEALFSDTCATPVQNAPYISARGGGGGHGGGGHGGHGVGGGHFVGGHAVSGRAPGTHADTAQALGSYHGTAVGHDFVTAHNGYEYPSRVTYNGWGYRYHLTPHTAHDGYYRDCDDKPVTP